MTPREIAGVLESSGVALGNLLRALPRDAATWHAAPDQWCVNECAGHIIEAERRGFNGRIRTILAEDEPRLQGWDPAAIARERADCERDPGKLLAEFEPLRRDSVQLVRSLGPEELERAGIHPEVERLTVNDLIHEWVHHDGNHLRQAIANVQAYVWPDMGNARRFSSG